MPPFGSTSQNPGSLNGAIYCIITIHNSDIESPAPSAYEPQMIEDHTENYYKYAMMAGVRMIDYLVTLPK